MEQLAFESDDERLARKLYEMVWNVIGPYTIHRKYDFTDWADEIRLMRTRDGRSHDEIEKVFRWANQNEEQRGDWSGWRTLILSPKALRKHWDAILGAMVRNDTRKYTGSPGKQPISLSAFEAARSVGRD
ncbi:MAG: hypothetical protein ACHQNE_07455 [Candidatus Kapaibacterium sp.]